MKKLLILATFFTLCSTNLMALDTPNGSKLDKRVSYATYNADDVFLVKCKNGYVSMLEFDKDERIINIATGFSQGWELIDKDNFLFIKPKSYQINQAEQTMVDENGEQIEFTGSSFVEPNASDWNTNLIVTTNNRIYVFDLVIDDEINYKVQFSYPHDKKIKDDIKKMAEQRAKEEKAELAKLETETNRVNVPRNWNYMAHINKDSEDIMPDFAYDDGVFTYLGFSSIKTIPSVFLFDKKNNESILNTHLKKDGNYDVLVIHKTAKQILLRSGDKLVGILNQGYGKNPLSKTYDTTKQNIVREIIEDE